jgi:shikimate kinase
MNVVLIGMPGAGKSSLGVLLAKALGMDFIDTDILIQQAKGRLLQEIIDSHGINQFMKMEETVISALQADNTVIATGGSAVYSDAAMHALRRSGRILYLHVSFEEIERRVNNIASRGIVLKRGAGLRDIYDERVPLYRQHADVTLDCAGKTFERCVSELAALAANLPSHTKV